MLIRHFYLKDIKEYEDETGYNILSFFGSLEINKMIDLVKIGNSCTYEQACNLLDEYLEEHTLLEALLEIKKSLIGVGDNNEEDIAEEDKIDITKYSSLTELYQNFCMQLMSFDVSYSEFWSMDTKDMYRVFNSLLIKMQNDTNRQLSNYHTLAGLVGQAVWGKLQKEAPQIKVVNENKDVDDEVAITNARLLAMVAQHNNKLKIGEE